RSGGHLERDLAGRRGHLDVAAERGFPRRERQVDVEILAVDTEDRMRRHLDVEIEIAVAPAVDALAALACDAQLGAVGDAFRDAHLEVMRHPAHHTLFVDLGGHEIELDFGPAIGLVERELDAGLEVLPGNGPVRRVPAAARATAQAGKEVGEIDILEAPAKAALPEARAPIGRRTELLAFRMATELVVRGALLRILEGFVGLLHLLE